MLYVLLCGSYCIVQNFNGGIFDVFDASQPLDCRNLTRQFFKIITVFTGAW